MGEHIYNLHYGENSPNSFYVDLSIVTDRFIDFFKQQKAYQRVQDFTQFISDKDVESQRSANEYIIEYLMIGMLWKDYSGYAANLSKSTAIICDVLYAMRSRAGKLKPMIDHMRGKVHTGRLLKNEKHHELLPSRGNLIRLIKWLEATRDFTEETNRIRNWSNFLADKSPIYISNFIGGCLEINRHFENIASPVLTKYTPGIQKFLSKAKKYYHNREDIIFCTRPPTHYYFNWVAAEILNRGLKESFSKAPNKIVLLPTCMSAPEHGICKAKTSGRDIRCTGCSNTCRINTVRNQLMAHEIEVRLIPHSTGFSKWLEPYRNDQDTGLVGVACALNLLKGGYEMKSMNIPSQCVFLNHCGCHKHWPAINKPTDLDTAELLKKLNIKQEPLPNWEIILNEIHKPTKQGKIQVVSSPS